MQLQSFDIGDMAPFVRALLIVCLLSSRVAAQDPAPDQAEPAQPGPSSPWTWTTDANVFAGFNYQDRRYVDYGAWESQNWFMATAGRPVGDGRLTVGGMLSLEPLTLGRYVFLVGSSRFRAGGSPQLFQTGESFRRVPLVAYQHPHDLIMGLGATYRLPRQRVAYTIGADLVGSPTLGPTPFMHRESGRDNPQVPLSHHNLDSTHSTAGVVRAGIDVAGWTFEGSVFRGEEPDEQKYDIDQPRLDSWAARIVWRRGPWQAQFSGGLLHEPEWFEPFDQKRFTASIAFTGSIASRPLAATAAWGQTREDAPSHPVSDAYLVEWDLRVSRSFATYGRTEFVKKDIFPHVEDRRFPEPHFFYDVGAVTLGVLQDLSFLRSSGIGRLGIGGDVTLYRMPADLQLLYAGSRSFHAFLRWRPSATASQHVH